MRKLMTLLSIIGILTLGLLTGGQQASAEMIEPKEGDKYYPYVESYIKKSNDKVKYNFMQSLWKQEHHDSYMNKYNEKDKAKLKDLQYVFANPTYDEDGMLVNYSNEYISTKLWNSIHDDKPKEGAEYITVVKLFENEDGLPKFERVDIIEITGDEKDSNSNNDSSDEIIDNTKPTCQLKKTVNGYYKRVCSN